MRIALYILTNLGVLLVVSIVIKVLGIEQSLAVYGIHTNFIAMLIFCALFGICGSLTSLLLSKSLAIMGTRTQLIQQPSSAREQWLLDTVTELAQQAGINTPSIGIFPTQQANAFASGWNKNEALIAVSAGLLQRFREDETRAVLAHEIAHIANGDMLTLALIQGLVNTFVMFFARIIGHTVDRILFKNESGYGVAYWVANILFQMLFGILASAVVMWFSRSREFKADKIGANLAGRQPMTQALEHLKADYDLPEELPGEMIAFGINGVWNNKASRLFASHPKLDDRIAALLKHQ